MTSTERKTAREIKFVLDSNFYTPPWRPAITGKGFLALARWHLAQIAKARTAERRIVIWQAKNIGFSETERKKVKA